MHNSKFVSICMFAFEKLTLLDGCTFEDPQLFYGVVGRLQYLTFIRPDISFVVNRVCQHIHFPQLPPHWTTVKCIMCYLNHTCHLNFYFSTKLSLTLSAFSNVDLVRCPDDKYSTGGFCVYFGAHLISWNSKKQPTLGITRSSTKAEYKPHLFFVIINLQM